MSKSKSNSDDSVEVYTDEEIKLLDHYHEYSNNLFDDDELYDIFTRFNFNEELIQVEIDQLMREMKKGKEYQWHDPNEKTKEPTKEKKSIHDKQGKKEYVNKYKNNYSNNYYYQNQKNYTYNNNYYNRNYNNYYNRRYNNRYNSNNYYYNNKRRYNDNKKYRTAKELKEVEITTPIQSGEDTHEVIPEKVELKNEIEKEEKVEVEPVQEMKPDVVEIEYKDNQEEVEVSHVPKPSKAKEPEQEKPKSVISETIETVSFKKDIQPSFEVYENTTFTLESAKPKKTTVTPTEQAQYQPQQPTYQMPGNYPMYPFPFYPQYYNMMMPQGTAPQEGQPEAQQMPMYPQYPYYPYPYQMTEQQRAYMMNHK